MARPKMDGLNLQQFTALAERMESPPFRKKVVPEVLEVILLFPVQSITWPVVVSRIFSAMEKILAKLIPFLENK